MHVFYKKKNQYVFASKAFTEAQQGLESLAVAWAMERFHHFSVNFQSHVA